MILLTISPKRISVFGPSSNPSTHIKSENPVPESFTIHISPPQAFSANSIAPSSNDVLDNVDKQMVVMESCVSSTQTRGIYMDELTSDVENNDIMDGPRSPLKSSGGANRRLDSMII